MNLEEKAILLAVKLNRLTVERKIQWGRGELPAILHRGTDDVIVSFLTCRYKGERFAIFQRRSKQYDGDRDMFYWTDSPVLALVDFNGVPLWETDRYSSALSDLFDSARRSASDIDNVIDGLLSDDE